jgi:ATP-dependent DNA helicase RecG
MTNQELISLLQIFCGLPAENEIVEFKEAKTDFHFDKIGKYFSALSNEANLKGQPFGWLIFGIENKRKTVVGSNYRSTNRAALDSLKSEVANKITNRITFIEIYEITVEGKRVIMFQIPAAPPGIPIAWEGHYFGRDGEELSPLNLEEIERIRKEVSRPDWSIGICVGASVTDLDPAAVAVARDNYKVKNSRLAAEVDQWDAITFLNKAKITINGKITRTAIILLGKPESEHFLSPAVAKITWVLKDKDNVEKDYAHYTCPFLLAVGQIYAKVRNLKYRYIKDGTLFPEEVDQYAPYNIREALSNCIAHQDYTRSGRITVIENEDGHLTFTNPGEFLPGSIAAVIDSDAPPGYYRNFHLATAMVSLNMIDTIGSGIKRMFRLQRERFFPMPDYDFSNRDVKTTLTGKVLDLDFARTLARHPALSLEEIIMLDKVQKHQELTEEEIKRLKGKGLIEGRKPNFHFSSDIAEKTDRKADYIKNRGFKDSHYKDMILEFIDKYGSATKEEIDKLLLDTLPTILEQRQKENKVRNLLYALSKRDLAITNTGTGRKPIWKRNKTATNLDKL